MKRYLLLLVLVCGLLTQASGQKEVLAQNPAKDSIPQTFGPNLKYYAHFLAGYGFMAGPAEGKGSRIRYGVSHEWHIGARFKYKVGEVYSLGFDAYINPQTFYLKQEEGKNLPNPLLHDMEKFKFTNIGLGFFNRFNYDKRGNYMGNFIDLGVYGNWMPIRNFIYQTDDLPPAVGYVTGANAIKVRQTGLKYITKLNYGATVRAGFNRYVFYATYRLSDLFDADHAVSDGAGNIYTFAEMPRATIGFQLSMHK